MPLGSEPLSGSNRGSDSGKSNSNSSEKASESLEKQGAKQPEHLGKAQKEAVDGKESLVSAQTTQQRLDLHKRVNSKGEPQTATIQQGGRLELKDGDKTLIPGHRGTFLDKSSEGQLNKISYPDGSSREFKYAKNGEVNEYTARDGSQWKSKDSLHWENNKGGESMTGVMRVGKDGSFTFLNAGNDKTPAHLSMTRPDGTTINDSGAEMQKALKDLTAEGMKSFDKTGDRKVSRAELEQAIVDPNVTGGKAIAAAMLYNMPGHGDLSQKDLNTQDFDKVIGNFGKMAQLGARTELKPENPAELKPSDIVQGCYENCKFISAMASKVSTPGGNDAVLNMVQKDATGYNVTFANQQKVHVSELTTGEKILGARSNSGMLYATVLEKAYGQLRNQEASGDIGHNLINRSIKGLDGLSSAEELIPGAATRFGQKDDEATHVMCGSKQTETLLTHKTLLASHGNHIVDSVKELMNPNEALTKLDSALTQAKKEHRVITAGITDSQSNDLALRDHHQYSVLDYKDNMVHLRDPHGDLPEERDPTATHPINNGNTGEFWMSLKDFNHCFNEVAIQGQTASEKSRK